MEVPIGAVGEVFEQVGKQMLRGKKTQFQKESKEHPSFSSNMIAQIVHDHDHGFYAHSISGKTDCFYKNVGNTTGKKRI